MGYSIVETDASKTHVIEKYHVKSRKRGLCFPICFPACWNVQNVYHFKIEEKGLMSKYFVKDEQNPEFGIEEVGLDSKYFIKVS